ncbi:hypothetical protein TNCV_1498242 [Trichonephila clavipes]|nr:hypothetical protein TNCV_1498242 [Trichonephila clavipes]
MANPSNKYPNFPDFCRPDEFYVALHCNKVKIRHQETISICHSTSFKDMEVLATIQCDTYSYRQASTAIIVDFSDNGR